jgi:hypothetical protein
MRERIVREVSTSLVCGQPQRSSRLLAMGSVRAITGKRNAARLAVRAVFK